VWLAFYRTGRYPVEVTAGLSLPMCAVADLTAAADKIAPFNVTMSVFF
jgi:hypothetical protein